MSRELKFRAWHKPTNRMFEVHALTPYNVYENSMDGCFSSPTLPAVVEDCEVLQYIGLNDWDGKDIYEGDIVVGMQNGVIVYHKASASFGLSTDGSGQIETMYWLNNDICSTDIQIIGNIYETPELINATMPPM